MNTETSTSTIDTVILKALIEYIRGRAAEIIAEHTKAAQEEINSSVRDEISRTVLSIGKMVHIKRNETEIVITIQDQRKEAGEKE